MLVHGGYGDNGAMMTDTWELTLTGTPTWNQLSPVGPAPGERYNHLAILDPVRDRLVIAPDCGLGLLTPELAEAKLRTKCAAAARV